MVILEADLRLSICHLYIKDVFERETRKAVGRQDREGKGARQRCYFRAIISLLLILQKVLGHKLYPQSLSTSEENDQDFHTSLVSCYLQGLQEEI